MSKIVPDAAFAEPRLAALYDLAEADRIDLIHYVQIVDEVRAQDVLDLGCGTGTLACALAERGVRVVGVDPAQASLQIARYKQGAELVHWILGDAAAAAAALPAQSIDLVLMTGNVAQVFVTHADWLAMLVDLRSLLRPGGHLVFEVRDPAHEGWKEWTKEQSHSFVDSPVEGQVETWVDLVDVSPPLVTFQWTFRFERDGAEMFSESTLRFRERAEVESSLAAAGYDVLEVRGAPDRPNKEFVFIARVSCPTNHGVNSTAL